MIDCKAAKHVLEKNVQNIGSKQIFARWQAILSVFNFDIEFIKGDTNSIPDFLTREFFPNRKMPPKKKDKGKGVLKDPVPQTPSKDSPPKEKLLSSAMPIKS